MSNQALYKSIDIFKTNLAKRYDKKNIKEVEKYYLYVNNDEAVDKAEFIKFLISKKYMKDSYNNILDIAFGSANLTSHIVFDNDIKYNTITFNDINTDKSNQDITSHVDNSTLTNYDMLDINNFTTKYDLVIINPQMGGSSDGDIYAQRKADETIEYVLNKLYATLSKFYESGSTIVYYGKDKDFNSIFKDEKYYKYMSEHQNLFIVHNDISNTICFEKEDDKFIINNDCESKKESQEIIESFDDVSIDLDNFENEDNMVMTLNEEKVEKIEKLKELFSNEKKGNLDFQYKNILFKGVPGTGKSRAIDTIIKDKLKIKDEKRNILRVNIHSASSNSDLMQGIGISTSSNGTIKYSEKQGLILDIIKRATFNPNQPFVLILEEIQENSLNELIGDLIYLIEDDKRAKNIEADNKEYSYEKLVNKLIDDNSDIKYIEIPYLVNDSTDYKKMIMPNNLYIFCTSNYRDDKKVIEDNLLRRFEVIEIYPKNQEEMKKDENGDYYFKSKEVSDFLESLNLSILNVMQKQHETHPDRFIIGHSIWKDVIDETTFYKAFSKLITEFKDIREIEFDTFKDIIKNIKIPYLDIKIENIKSYFNLIKDIQEKIKYDFIS